MTRYKMLGKDLNALPPVYRTWVHETPDLDGYYYTGAKAGTLPLQDIVAYVLPDGYVGNFHLPKVLNWHRTKQVLPHIAAKSQIAVIGNFIYLFGGRNSNKILRAPVESPCEWVDTGHTLPTELWGSQLAIVGDTVWLFGGSNGSATDSIYYASLSNPLSWSIHSSKLPRRLQDSQLALIDGAAYLFGGKETNNATNAILRASATDLTNWSVDGYLPTKLYGSELAIVGDNIYLYGGFGSDTLPVKTIWACQLSTPLSWYVEPINNLPHKMGNAKFVALGDKGYLFANPRYVPPGASSGVGLTHSFTRIYRCDLSHPTQFIDTKRTVTGQVYESSFAIINDVIHMFGGNGNTAIYAHESFYKFRYGLSTAVAYGEETRTNFESTSMSSPLSLFTELGFAPWKTDFGNLF